MIIQAGVANYETHGQSTGKKLTTYPPPVTVDVGDTDLVVDDIRAIRNEPFRLTVEVTAGSANRTLSGFVVRLSGTDKGVSGKRVTAKSKSLSGGADAYKWQCQTPHGEILVELVRQEDGAVIRRELCTPIPNSDHLVKWQN